MLPTLEGLNSRPPGLQSDAHPTEPPRPANDTLTNDIVSFEQIYRLKKKTKKKTNMKLWQQVTK